MALRVPIDFDLFRQRIGDVSVPLSEISPLEGSLPLPRSGRERRRVPLHGRG